MTVSAFSAHHGPFRLASATAPSRDPFRPADWRIRLAHDLHDARSAGTPPPPADAWAHRAAWYFDDESDWSALPPHDRARLLHAHGPIATAIRLFRERTQIAETASRSGLAILAVEIEAYLLAGQPPAAAARRCGGGLTADDVQAYAALAFDVADRLLCPSWICGDVIGPLHAGSRSPRSSEALLLDLARAYGYFTRNPRIVQFFLSGLDGPEVRRAGRRGGVNAAIRADLHSAVAYKAILAARRFEPSGRGLRTAVEMYAKLAEDARQAGLGASALPHSSHDGPAYDQFRDAVDRLFAAAPLHYGHDPVLTPTPPPHPSLRSASSDPDSFLLPPSAPPPLLGPSSSDNPH